MVAGGLVIREHKPNAIGVRIVPWVIGCEFTAILVVMFLFIACVFSANACSVWVVLECCILLSRDSTSMRESGDEGPR